MGVFKDAVRQIAVEQAEKKRNEFLQRVDSLNGRFCACFSSPSMLKDLNDIDKSINQFLLEYPEFRIVSMAAGIGVTGKVICYFERIEK